jgi:hypothetical protein
MLIGAPGGLPVKRPTGGKTKVQAATPPSAKAISPDGRPPSRLATRRAGNIRMKGTPPWATRSISTRTMEAAPTTTRAIRSWVSQGGRTGDSRSGRLRSPRR